MSKRIFISYRRDGGEVMAQLLYERFVQRGYTVFYDVETLRSGPFNKKLYKEIEECDSFILVLPNNALDRCVYSEDWVRKEIAHALICRKNVIPVMLRGFSFPEKLPKDIDALRWQNGVLIESMDCFNSKIDKIESMLTPEGIATTGELNARVSSENQLNTQTNNLTNKGEKRRYLRIAALIIPYLTGLSLPLLLYYLQIEFTFWLRLLYFGWIMLGALWIWNRIETSPEIAALCFGTLEESDLKRPPAEVFSKVASVFGKKAFISNNCPEGFVSYYKLKRLEFGSWDGEKTNYLRVQFKRSFEYYDPSIFHLHSLSKGGQAIKMLTKQGFIIASPPPYMSPEEEYLRRGDVHINLRYKGRTLKEAVVYLCSDDELIDHY